MNTAILDLDDEIDKLTYCYKTLIFTNWDECLDDSKKPLHGLGWILADVMTSLKKITEGDDGGESEG